MIAHQAAFNAREDSMRKLERVGHGIATAAVVIWLLWLASVTDGFRNAREESYWIVLGISAAIYITLAFGIILLGPIALRFLSKTSKEMRLVLSFNILWIFCLASWGYIMRWQHEFSGESYIALFILPCIASWLSLGLWKWSKAK